MKNNSKNHEIKFEGDAAFDPDQFEEQTAQCVKPGRQNLLKKNFAKDPSKVPDWRTIYKGLTLQGICDNPSCPAYQQRVWVKKGYGKFQLNEELHVSICPVPNCQEQIINVKNMALYKAKARIQGKISGQKKLFRITHQTDPNTDQYITFDDADEFIKEWHFLNIVVSQEGEELSDSSSSDGTLDRSF